MQLGQNPQEQRKLLKSLLQQNHFVDWIKEHIENGCGLYARTTKDSANLLYYSEGRRSVALDLLELIQSIANEYKVDYTKLNIYYKR